MFSNEWIEIEQHTENKSKLSRKLKFFLDIRQKTIYAKCLLKDHALLICDIAIEINH